MSGWAWLCVKRAGFVDTEILISYHFYMSHNNPTGIPPNIAGATFNQWGTGENGRRQPLFLWRDGSAAVPVRFLRGVPVSPERGCPQRWPALSLLHWLFLLPSLMLCSLPPASWDHLPNHQNPSPHLSLWLGEPKLWPPATLEPCSESHWVLCRITGLVTLPCGYRTRRAVKARTTSVSPGPWNVSWADACHPSAAHASRGAGSSLWLLRFRKHFSVSEKLVKWN